MSSTIQKPELILPGKGCLSLWQQKATEARRPHREQISLSTAGIKKLCYLLIKNIENDKAARLQQGKHVRRRAEPQHLYFRHSDKTADSSSDGYKRLLLQWRNCSRFSPCFHGRQTEHCTRHHPAAGGPWTHSHTLLGSCCGPRPVHTGTAGSVICTLCSQCKIWSSWETQNRGLCKDYLWEDKFANTNIIF